MSTGPTTGAEAVAAPGGGEIPPPAAAAGTVDAPAARAQPQGRAPGAQDEDTARPGPDGGTSGAGKPAQPQAPASTGAEVEAEAESKSSPSRGPEQAAGESRRRGTNPSAAAVGEEAAPTNSTATTTTTTTTKEKDDEKDREKLLCLLQAASDSPDEDDDTVQDDDEDDTCNEEEGSVQVGDDTSSKDGKKKKREEDAMNHQDKREVEEEEKLEGSHCPSPSPSSSPPSPRKRKAETVVETTPIVTENIDGGASASAGAAAASAAADAASNSVVAPSTTTATTGSSTLGTGVTGVAGFASSSDNVPSAAASASTTSTDIATPASIPATIGIAAPTGRLNGLAATALATAAAATMAAPGATPATAPGATNGIAFAPSSTKKRRRRAVPRKPTFAQKLMTILADPACRDALSWMPDGQSFVIVNPGIFGHLVMGRYFGNKSAKFESFTRKLNRWGFKRITIRGSSTAVAYCHHLFQRDNPELCDKMKGDGGLRATDEERQAAAAAGIDPRRAQGLAGMTPAEIARRQIELEKERELRKAGLADPPYKKKSKGGHTAAVATGSAASGVPSTAAAINTIPGTAAGAGAVAGAPQGLAANVAASELMGELDHLRRIGEEKGRLQAQAALAAAAYSTASLSGSPFLRPSAATAATAIGANVFAGSMPGMMPAHQSQIPQSSTSLLENQLRIQQQLEIEHERLYLERIKQERQVEEQRLRAIQQQQLQQQLHLGAASAMSSPAALPALPPGGVHHNPALALAASSGLITHPLGPPVPEGSTNVRSNESHSNALNNYYDSRNRLIAATFDAEDGKTSSGGGPEKEGTGK